MSTTLDGLVSKGPSDEVKCPLEPRVDSGERTLWKERKPSSESLRRIFKISKLANSENKKGASVLEEQPLG